MKNTLIYKLLHFEDLSLAFRYVMGNLLRSILTILVIVFGIMSLVGMLTAIDGLKSSLLSNFSQLGSNSFSISDINYFASENGRPVQYPKISHRDIRIFKERYTNKAIVSANYTASQSAIVKFKSNKTNPRIRVIGTDENYFVSSSLNIDEGRNFNHIETQYGANVVILGSGLKRELFGNANAMGKVVTSGSGKYKVIGILEKKGATFGMSYDHIFIVPMKAARKNFASQNESYTLGVQVSSYEKLDVAVNEAIAIFRMVRQLKPKDENNFDLQKSDNLINIITKQLRAITIVTLVISLITLISSAVALMNIMLVSVKERIREIGTMKALGATVDNVKRQFLSEALIVSQIGSAFGIVFGIAIGNLFASKMGSEFVIPWGWVIFAVIMSIVVGITAGYYPAVKAARMDPIDALRHE
ncbi:MAG: FtsX-like permease family protein [Bacteroidetes bacterium]|jgi:putative ABC transport system permease protein|nr:FtsX-like permease family protein [Bacteroidota bacterium]MBT5531055.1 FtsX-like permease family protein [Cytophagia bacterium]MBT4339501.1 FtsX-like permease family protein [Bacteroidota bacterium]MBT4968422.1 FtsX-like permease family protein [Bacteroidota bacterium]MBT5991283.1 FtsX-like permease family protein [Bacteroidota bacterium]